KKRVVKTPRGRRPPGLPSVESAAHRALAVPQPPPPWVGLGAALLGLVLALFAKGPILAVLSASFIAGAAGAALWIGWPSRRDVGWLAWILAPLGALLAAIAALLARAPQGDARLWLVGAAIAAGAVVLRAWLDVRSSQPVDRLVGLLVANMPEIARVPPRGSDLHVELEWESVPAARVRAGQEILVGEGEVVA